MNSSIKIYNSYLKGTKTITGNFPIYFSSYELTNNITSEEKEDILNQIREIESYYIISETSDAYTLISLLIPTAPDKFIPILFSQNL